MTEDEIKKLRVAIRRDTGTINELADLFEAVIETWHDPAVAPIPAFTLDDRRYH